MGHGLKAAWYLEFKVDDWGNWSSAEDKVFVVLIQTNSVYNSEDYFVTNAGDGINLMGTTY